MSKQIKNFAEVNFKSLKLLDKEVAPVFQKRMNEAELCLVARCPLAAIILYSSILEGLLFKCAKYYPQKFNTAKSCPKEKGKPKKISKWTFDEFINVSHEIELLKPDTKKYVEIMQGFRNYVHIQEQISHNIDFSEESAYICRMTLILAIRNIKKFKD